VPAMILLERDPGPIGTPFYLMERLEGRVFHDSALPGLAPADRRAVWRTTARTLARLHAADWRSIGLGDFGRAGGYFSRQVARWTKQWHLSRTREDHNIEALSAWLAGNIPPDERTTIVHGDFRIGNIMFAPDTPEIAGVLDWELSTLGHPLADLAHLGTFWDFAPDELGGIAGLDHRALGLPERQAFFDDYQAAGGCEAPVTAFHRAFALFRFAVIFEGIAARHRSGIAASPDAMRVGGLSAACAARAIDLLSRDGI
jgi:aminoglycoside phosphotransferase (APT) family kinase protein